MVTIDFQDWLQEQLDKRNLTQADLSKLSGLTTSAISRLLTGSRGIGPEACKSIAHALHLPTETVYRAAGLLPPIKIRDSKREILLHLADQLSDEDYTEVVRYTELRLAIAEEKGKYASAAPQEST